MLFVLFVMATTVLDLVWMFGMMRKTLPQILAVMLMFTWPFSKLASESDVARELRTTCDCGFDSCFAFPEVAWNDILFIRIVAGFATIFSLSRLPSLMPRTFSFGELCVVMQLVIPFLSVSVSCIVSQFLRLEYSFCEHNNPTKVIRVIAVALAVFVVVSKFIFTRFLTRRSELVAIAFVSCIALAYYTISRCVAMEPIHWLIRYLTRSHHRVSFAHRVFHLKLVCQTEESDVAMGWLSDREPDFRRFLDEDDVSDCRNEDQENLSFGHLFCLHLRHQRRHRSLVLLFSLSLTHVRRVRGIYSNHVSKV